MSTHQDIYEFTARRDINDLLADLRKVFGDRIKALNYTQDGSGYQVWVPSLLGAEEITHVADILSGTAALDKDSAAGQLRHRKKKDVATHVNNLKTLNDVKKEIIGIERLLLWSIKKNGFRNVDE